MLTAESGASGEPAKKRGSVFNQYQAALTQTRQGQGTPPLRNTGEVFKLVSHIGTRGAPADLRKRST